MTPAESGYCERVCRTAHDYLDKGWAVIPVPFRSKNPGITAWPNLRLTHDDVDREFTAKPRGIGVLLGKPSNGLFDVDADSAEAIALAPCFLPPTGWRHGRPSKRASHYVYRVSDRPDVPTKQFKIDEGMLVEGRGTGGQSIFPPSIHEEGEAYELETTGEPAIVTLGEIGPVVRRLAAAALIARYWREHIRHATALPLAGFLLRGGMSVDDVIALLKPVAEVCGDPEWADRERAIRDTAEKLHRGEPATGGPTLAEHLGDVFVSKLRDWLDLRGGEKRQPSRHEREQDGDELATVDPIDIFGDSSLAGSPDLPPGLLPPVIEQFAHDAAARIGVAPGVVALGCLVTAATAADDGFRVQPKQHDTQWVESPRLWAAIVDDSGAKKTPVLNAVTDPLKILELRFASADAEAIEKYELAEKIYQRALTKHADKCAGGKAGATPEKPKRVRRRRLLADDTTIEALADILVDNPRGVLVWRDELSGWVGSFDAYNKAEGKDRAAWLEAYNGGAKRVDRVKRGPMVVPNWSVSMLGGIQPGALRRIAAKINDDGLLQRFIVVFGRGATEGEDRKPDYAALKGYEQVINALVAAVPDKRHFTLSEAAQRERRRVTTVVQHLMVLPDVSPPFRAHLGKWEGLLARLVLLFHLVDCATQCADPTTWPREIPVETARRVTRFMLDFLLPNSARFYTTLFPGTENLANARWIAGYILAHGSDRISARDIGRAHHELRSDKKAIQDAMSVLETAGWVTPQGKYPPPTKWQVNPTVHELFKDRAEREREEREHKKEQIRRAAEMVAAARAGRPLDGVLDHGDGDGEPEGARGSVRFVTCARGERNPTHLTLTPLPPPTRKPVTNRTVSKSAATQDSTPAARMNALNRAGWRGWPALKLGEAVSVSAGEPAWREFVRTASADQLQQASALLAAMVVGDEAGDPECGESARGTGAERGDGYDEAGEAGAEFVDDDRESEDDLGR